MPTPERLEKFTYAASHRQRDLCIVFEDMTDPHNIQAVVRTADALGVQDIHVIFEETAPVNLRKVGHSSSSSANNWVTYHTYKSTKKCLKTLKKQGYAICATALTDTSKNFYDVDFLEYDKVALLFGNEHAGLTDTALTYADETICIPMRGIIQSLNLSVTAAITMYEVVRQRRISDSTYTLDQAEITDLVDHWLK